MTFGTPSVELFYIPYNTLQLSTTQFFAVTYGMVQLNGAIGEKRKKSWSRQLSLSYSLFMTSSARDDFSGQHISMPSEVARAHFLHRESAFVLLTDIRDDQRAAKHPGPSAVQGAAQGRGTVPFSEKSVLRRPDVPAFAAARRSVPLRHAAGALALERTRACDPHEDESRARAARASGKTQELFIRAFY